LTNSLPQFDQVRRPATDVEAADDLKGGRVKNRRRVLDLLRQNGALSQAGLSDHTGLSRATVSGLVAELRQHGLAINREMLPEQSRTGRPPAMIALADSVGAAVGMNVTADAIQVAVGNVGLDVLTERKVRPAFSIGSEPRATLELTAGIVQELLTSAGWHRSQVIGGAIGVPAPIDYREGSVGLSTSLPGEWLGLKPAAMLEALVGFPVLLENDANLSAFAETAAGAAKGAEEVLYIEASYLVGCGVIVNGRVHRGFAGGAGEIAHMIVRPGGPLCFCGRKGCLGMVVYGGTILDEVRDGLRRRLAASEFDSDALDAPDLGRDQQLDLVVDWALRGDPISARVLSDAGHELGFAVANVCQILNPERVVVGGALTRAGNIFMDQFTEAIHGLTTQLPGWPVTIVPARWQDRAELIGAVALGVRAENATFAERLWRLVEGALLDRPSRLASPGGSRSI
jgi:predicted NBD/HSP70 family sugar kinase